MNHVKDLISQLDTGIYEFKEPWRATNKSLTIVVPIVAKTKGKRNYVVLEEVKDKIKIVDTGGINKARIEGDVDKPTFIRGGTMLKGATQARATQFGIMVMPQKSDKIPVHCIHASRGIRPGVSFHSGGYAPRRVYSTMLSERNQSRTWSEISDYSARMMKSVRVFGARYDSPRDDLVQSVETLHKWRRDLREILKQIPDHVNQVGTVVIDPDGVVGFEMYDHPDSWKAFSESIIRSYAEALTKEDKTGIFKPDMTAIIPLIHSFLKNLQKAKEEEVFDKNKAKTVILRAEGFVGEYTTLKEKTIHLLVTRSNPTRTTKRLPRRRALAPPHQSTVQRVIDWGKTFKRKMKNAIQVLTTLRDKPKTWTAIKSKARMSKATLSSRLKELQELGAIEKGRDENGATRYSLTGIGHEYLRHQRKSSSLRLSRPVSVRRTGSLEYQQIPAVWEARYMDLQPEEACPKCRSPDISVWSFDTETVNYECNICRHKWTGARWTSPHGIRTKTRC